MTDDSLPIELAAPTTAGKGTGHVVPDLSDWDGPVVFHDPKPATPAWSGQRFAPDPAKRSEWSNGEPDKGDDQ